MTHAPAFPVLRRWLRPAAALLLMLLLGSARAEGFDALWGLRWGQTPAEVQGLVQGWHALARDGDLDFYGVRSRLVRHPAFIVQIVGFRAGRLAEVRSFSQPFTADDEGRVGRAAHLMISRSLSERYGEAGGVHEQMLPLDRQPAGGFYACLREADCAVWARTWTHASAFVVLELRPAKAAGSGWLSLRALAPESRQP